MADPFTQIKSINPAIKKVGFITSCFSAQVTGRCNCGFPDPITIHFIPGVDIKGICPECQCTFIVNELGYDHLAAPGKLNVAVSAHRPTIVRPGPTRIAGVD